MRDKPIVSIHCLVYNHELYLRQCLDGFVMQKTDFEFELVIGEDASQDKTREICFNYQKQYPDKIPVIVEKDPRAKTLNDIDKTKYLVPCVITVAQFTFMIRKRLQLNESEALFLIAKEKYTISGETNMNDVYQKYSDKEDGYLYITYSSKEIWGHN